MEAGSFPLFPLNRRMVGCEEIHDGDRIADLGKFRNCVFNLVPTCDGTNTSVHEFWLFLSIYILAFVMVSETKL